MVTREAAEVVGSDGGAGEAAEVVGSGGVRERRQRCGQWRWCGSGGGGGAGNTCVLSSWQPISLLSYATSSSGLKSLPSSDVS